MNTRNYMLRTLLAATLLVLVVAMAQAQMPTDAVKVNIPFSFNIGAQTFPAGEYTLKPLLAHAVLLRNRSGRTIANVPYNSIESREPQKATRLVFNGYGNQYFPAQIWRADDNIGGELMRSAAEIEIAKRTPAQQLALVKSNR